MLYVVSYSWYEDYSPTIVEGPEVEDWRSFCDNLMEIAANRVVDKKPDSWIGWDTIVEQLVVLLEERGYKIVEPPEAGYWGSIIIRDETDQEDEQYTLLRSARSRIIEHNEAIKAELNRMAQERSKGER